MKVIAIISEKGGAGNGFLLSTNLGVTMSKPTYYAYSVREYEKDGKKDNKVLG